MIFAKCIELKELITRYNRKQYKEENCLQYEFGMFTDGAWSCFIKCEGCVFMDDFKDIYDFCTILGATQFMYGGKYGFRVHIQ